MGQTFLSQINRVLLHSRQTYHVWLLQNILSCVRPYIGLGPIITLSTHAHHTSTTSYCQPCTSLSLSFRSFKIEKSRNHLTLSVHHFKIENSLNSNHSSLSLFPHIRKRKSFKPKLGMSTIGFILVSLIFFFFSISEIKKFEMLKYRFYNIFQLYDFLKLINFFSIFYIKIVTRTLTIFLHTK